MYDGYVLYTISSHSNFLLLSLINIFKSLDSRETETARAIATQSSQSSCSSSYIDDCSTILSASTSEIAAANTRWWVFVCLKFKSCWLTIIIARHDLHFKIFIITHLSISGLSWLWQQWQETAPGYRRPKNQYQSPQFSLSQAPSRPSQAQSQDEFDETVQLGGPDDTVSLGYPQVGFDELQTINFSDH